MWWVEEAEKDLECERQKKFREKRDRQLINRQLKDYCDQLAGASVPNAEALLNRAVETYEMEAASAEL